MKRLAVFLITFLFYANSAYGLDPASVKKSSEANFDFYVGYLDKGTTEERRFALIRISSYLKFITYRLDPSPLNKVFSALKDNDPEIREAAAVSLKLVGKYSNGCCRQETEIVPKLIAALEDPSARVREEAAKALGYYKDLRALKALAKRLEDEDRMVRLNAAYSLGMLHVVTAIPPLLALLERSGGAEDKIVGQEAIIALRKTFGSAGFSARAQVATVLLKKAQDRYLRLEIIKTLALYRIERARRLFEEALEDPDDNIKLQAAYGLSRLRKGQNAELDIKHFVITLNDPSVDDDVRRKAATSLGNSRLPRVLSPLKEALFGNNSGIRRQVIEALGKINTEETLKVLADFIARDAYGGEKFAAEQFMKVVKNIPSKKLKIKNLDGSGFVVYVNKVAVTVILENIDTQKIIGRVVLTRLLASTRDNRSVDRLIKLLNDSSSDVRRSAIVSLGRSGEERAILHIIAMMKDSDSSVRSQAIWSLLYFKDERVIEPLMNALNDSNGRIRGEALRGLSKYPEKVQVLDIALLMYKDEDASVRRDAVLIIGKSKNQRAVEPLLSLLNDTDSMVPWYAAKSLGNIGDPRAIEPLISALKGEFDRNRRFSGDSDLKRNAITSLRLLGDDRAIDPIIELLLNTEENGHVRNSAFRALTEEFKGARATRALIDLMLNQNKRDSYRSRGAQILLSKVDEPDVLEALEKVLDDESFFPTPGLMKKIKETIQSRSEANRATH